MLGRGRFIHKQDLLHKRHVMHVPSVHGCGMHGCGTASQKKGLGVKQHLKPLKFRF